MFISINMIVSIFDGAIFANKRKTFSQHFNRDNFKVNDRSLHLTTDLIGCHVCKDPVSEKKSYTPWN